MGRSLIALLVVLAIALGLDGLAGGMAYAWLASAPLKVIAWFGLAGLSIVPGLVLVGLGVSGVVLVVMTAGVVIRRIL